ncbi:hypothetical protein [Streptomyces sp. MH60]|uniref:hypothetical protein n=1 Tax=Streptomyces sp. MH60 TaxID=1940758 RepID=UPI000CEEA439|nr:hypothetical protein [Streptomyces sp. MH60]PPS89576.1 hypothetical protein BZZ08_01723 [Streptomyces sp. MH60]
MSGYRPQNRGNKKELRLGPGVTRRLKAAGVNVSPNAAKHTRYGIFVSARGEYISVYVDLGGEDAVREAAQEIARIVTSWGLAPEISEMTHKDGILTAHVRFRHPAPPPPAERRKTAPAEPDPEWTRLQADAVQANLMIAGYWRRDGVTVEQTGPTTVTVLVADDAADEVLTGVTEALRRKKYTVSLDGRTVTVRKPKKAKKPRPPQIGW